jgi:regulator of replication initiation timing
MGVFRDQLKGLIAADKSEEANRVFDALDKVLDNNVADIDEMKRELRKRDGIKPEDFARLEKERDELKTALSEQTKALDKQGKDLKAAQESVGLKTSRLEKLLKDDNLTKALLEAGVKNPAHLKGAAAMLREIVQVDEEKSEAFILAKDPKTGAETRKPLGEYIKNEWAASDDGKAYVSAPASSGGGSGNPGGGSGGGAGSLKAQYAEAEKVRDVNKMMSLKRQMQLEEGGKGE